MPYQCTKVVQRAVYHAGSLQLFECYFGLVSIAWRAGIEMFRSGLRDFSPIADMGTLGKDPEIHT